MFRFGEARTQAVPGRNGATAWRGPGAPPLTTKLSYTIVVAGMMATLTWWGILAWWSVRLVRWVLA
jgi:hypothetical protein